MKELELCFLKMVDEVEDYAILLLDINGIIQNWNKGAEKIKQYTAEEAIGQSFRMFYLPEDRATGLPERLLGEAVSAGKAVNEGWRVRKDQSKFWGSITITALHGDNGNIIGFSKVTRDLTEKKIAFDTLQENADELFRRNQQLQESEERYHKMIDEVQEYAIILLDINGTILNWNKGAEQIKGYSASEIIGKNFEVFYTHEDLVEKLPGRLLSKALLEGKAVQEGWRLRKDKTKFWGSITITALHDSHNRVIGFSKVTKDLTAKKIADDQLFAINRELVRQNKELEQFAYIASHDLQEPLRKIRIFTDLVLRNMASPQLASTYLAKINQSATRMTELIQSILSYSRLFSVEEELQQVSVKNIIDDVMQDYELLLNEKNAQVRYDSMPTLTASPPQINQLFANLIANALKYSERAPVISIQSKTVSYSDIPNCPVNVLNGHYTQISIEDNGIGFDEKYLDKIFGIFQRLHSKQLYQGTGIGLALCKRIMDNHRGFITVKSSPGMGSTFFVYFPLVL